MQKRERERENELFLSNLVVTSLFLFTKSTAHSFWGIGLGHHFRR